MVKQRGVIYDGASPHWCPGWMECDLSVHPDRLCAVLTLWELFDLDEDHRISPVSQDLSHR